MLNTNSVISDDNAAKTPIFAGLTSGNFSIKLADSEAEVKAAQKLRYDVFYKEMGAHPIRNMAEFERDYDEYDNYCDHLLVIDNEKKTIVGTYRALQKSTAEQNGITLYTETEYDYSKLNAAGGKIMEVSRSCVAEAYRSKMVINILWRGIASYVFSHQIDYLIGTPSFPGLDINEHKDVLAYLNAFHLAPENIRPRALEEFYVALPSVPKESINEREAFMKLPPLLKGYLRLGALVADGLYLDHQFNCIDTSIIVTMANIDDRMINYFTRNDG